MAKTGRLKQGDLGGKGASTQLCCVHQEPPPRGHRYLCSYTPQLQPGG